MLRHRLQLKRSITDMQVALLGDHEDPVGRDGQSFSDKAYRHSSVAQEDLGKQRGHGSEMVHDNDGHTHVVRQVAEQSDIRVEPPDGTADADNREAVRISRRRVSFQWPFAWQANGGPLALTLPRPM